MNPRNHLKKQSILFFLVLLASLACNNGSGPISPHFPDEAEVEMRSFDLMNQDRKQAGLAPLTLDPIIASVARAHSADMRDRNYFSHKTPEGKTFASRLKSAGIAFRVSGENLAHTTGITDPAQTANDEFLMDSAHRDVLLSPRFTRAGVGVVRSGTEYWITQDFIGQ